MRRSTGSVKSDRVKSASRRFRAISVSMSEALYNTRILRLAASIPFAERLENPQASVAKRSPICGSRVTVDVSLGPAGRIAVLGKEEIGRAASRERVCQYGLS